MTRCWRRSEPPPDGSAKNEPGIPEGVENAWRIHDAINGWTARADIKAAFALSLESTVLGAVVLLSGEGGPLSDLDSCAELWWYRIGVLLLIASACAAVAVVMPQIRSASTQAEASDNYIFFGHLRHWHAEKLAAALEERAILPGLARQLIVMSTIAWRKHRLLQISLVTAANGPLLLTIAGALNA